MDGEIYLEKPNKKDKKKQITKEYKWKSIKLLADSKNKWNNSNKN
jgi:hypothetical protein